MSAGCTRILSTFTPRKKQKAWDNTREERKKERKGEGAFYNGDDGDNDDENYNENMEAFVTRCSSNYVFLNISQISQEKTCVGVSF